MVAGVVLILFALINYWNIEVLLVELISNIGFFHVVAIHFLILLFTATTIDD